MRIHYPFLQKHIFQLLLVALLLLFLIPIWIAPYFVTLDGPTHLYNAKVMLDMLRGEHLPFYQDYYHLNVPFLPTWGGHMLMAGLMTVFSAALSEKIFLTAYFLTFVGAFYQLFRQTQPRNTYLALLVIPFLYHRSFQLGFLSCAWSFALGFLILAIWVQHRKALKIQHILLLTGLMTLLYYVHLLGLVIVAAGVLCYLLMDYIVRVTEKGRTIQPVLHSMLRDGISWLLISLPTFVLIGLYLSHKEMHTAPGTARTKDLYHALLELTSLQTIGFAEKPWILTISILFGLLGLWGLIQKFRSKKLLAWDGFFLAFVLMVYQYFHLPDSIAGGSILHVRFQLLPYLFLLVWLGQFSYGNAMKYLITGVVLVAAVGLWVVRIPYHLRINEALTEYLSAEAYIEPYSTVLPLSYDHFGRLPDQQPVSSMWQFMHVGDYLGVNKPMAMLSNYEANSGVFPVMYHYRMTPFVHLSTHEGQEYQPPSVDIFAYEEKTGIAVDYVLLWCLQTDFATHPYTEFVLQQLQEGYVQIYTSPHALVQLYRKKTQPETP